MFYGFILKMLLFTAHKFFGMYGSHNAIKCHLHTSLPFQPRYTGLRQIQPTILSTIDSLPAPDWLHGQSQGTVWRFFPANYCIRQPNPIDYVPKSFWVTTIIVSNSWNVFYL